MLDVSVAVLAVLCSASAAPAGGFFDVFESSYVLPPFGAPRPGFPFSRNPWNPWNIPPFGFPIFPSPWYKGDNVCKDEKVANEPEVSDMLANFGGGSQFNQESENCFSRNEEYLCIKRTFTNEGSKAVVTKYFCCDGFVLNPGGSGCVENGEENGPAQ